MDINEVFPNPTVKKVIFQIRFPNLFYIESKIGDLQLKIMRDFPESRLVHRKSIVFADLGPGVKPMDLAEDMPGEPWKKIWEFKSSKNVQLNVLSDSLDITSEHHKTYSNLESTEKFRDVIKSVVDSFLLIANIPIINRIGLRYIDECPMPDNKDNDSFKEFYDSAFPLHRFNLEDAEEMVSRAMVRKNGYFMRYMESLVRADNNWRIALDFDGFAHDVPAEDYLTVTDALHEIISKEFHKTIKEPVYEYMRQGKG